MIKKLLNIIRWLLILFLLLVLWISFGGSNDEENWRTKYYKQRALDRYDQACDKLNMTQAELNICSYKVAEEVDKEILKMTEDLEGFSLEDFKEFVHQAAIDQEYHGSIQPLRNNLFYIQKGAEYKVSIERKTLSTSILDDNPHLPTDCIRYIGMHIFTKDCIELMERWGGTWVNDSIMVFENDYSWHINAVDINKAYTADVYYTGKAKLTDANNRQDVLYLIYGHEFSYRVMNYENGKLEGVSTYFDKGGNPVLLEWYKDGELIEQSSGAHAVSGESIE